MFSSVPIHDTLGAVHPQGVRVKLQGNQNQRRRALPRRRDGSDREGTELTARMTDRNARRLAFWALQLTGWGAYALAVYLTSLPDIEHVQRPLLLSTKVYRAGLGMLATVPLHYMLRRLLARGAPARTLALASLGATLPLVLLWIAAYRLGATLLWNRDFWPIDWPSQLPTVLDFTSVLLGWCLLYLLLKFSERAEAERRRALEATSLAQHAQLAMLRYQLQPHFLFNALSSIRALVREDQERARTMVTQLAEFLRYTLETAPADMVPLAAEIASIRDYLAIEKVRFEDRLDVVIDTTPQAEECPVPGFLLNPLVENAVKHGARQGIGPLRILLRARFDAARLTIEVANT